jgi:hypothetical protein
MGAAMNQRSPQAGGCLLIAAIFLGTGIGIARGEPSIGFLAGLCAGVLLAVLVWLIDRSRVGR